MSVYYSYYIGYYYNGKIYPYGPYNKAGKFLPIIDRSQSFASDLHERFRYTLPGEMSDELLKEFPESDRCLWQTFNNLDFVSDDFIKRGYFRISEIQQYEREVADVEDSMIETDYIFSTAMTPFEYGVRLMNQARLGVKHEEDEYGNDISVDVRDYAYYAYPDYFSEQWEMNTLRQYRSVLFNDAQDELPSKAEPCVILHVY